MGMKRRMGKWSTVILIAALALNTACANNNREQKNNNAGEQAPTNQGEKVAQENPREKVGLSFWAAELWASSPPGRQEDPIMKHIEEKFNIELDMETQPSDEKLAAILATNDLKDIMVIPKKNFDQMKSLVIDMEPLLEKYGQDIKKNISPETISYYKEMFGDGQLKFLGSEISTDGPVLPETIWAGPYVRWDYYKELGYPAIETPDDYIKVVADMKKLHPNNEDGKPYHGFSLWLDWGYGILADHWNVRRQGAEVIGGLTNILQIDRESFEYFNKYTNENSGFWADLDFWNKANKAGLIDPDSWTQKYDQAVQKYNTGQVLATYINWVIGGSNSYLQSKQIYDKGWTADNPIPMSGENYYYNTANKGQNFVYAISKDSKNPERAMELINYFYSVEGVLTIINGVEGQDWVNENGEYTYTDTYFENEKDAENALKFGYRKYANQSGLDITGFVPGTKNPLDFRNNQSYMEIQLEKPENALKKEITSYYNAEFPNKIPPKGQEYGKTRIAELSPLLPPSEPDEIKLISDRIVNYLNQEVIKLILADDFAAHKAKIIKELEKMGIDKVYTFWDGEMQKALSELN